MKIFTIAILLLVFLAGSAHAITLGQVDDFQTNNGFWEKGGPAIQPNVVTSGGPQGAGDRYLNNSSDGNGSNGRFIIFNEMQWTGNYTAAGVTTIAMDIANFGTTALTMRVALGGGGGRFCTSGRTVPADGVWRRYEFSLTNATWVELTNNLPATLANVITLRILHNPIPAWRGEELVAQAGFDNITASDSAVPVESVSFSRVKSLFR